MAVPQGTHRLGPDSATLSVRTGREGAAAKAGHELLLHVGSWEATLASEGGPGSARIELAADPTSLRVIEGTGGIQALSDDDARSIEQTIGEEVLGSERIEFRSSSVRESGERLEVEGELTLAGRTNPISFELSIEEDGTIGAGTAVKQTAWGIKPYSALFGALKVADEVEVSLEGHL